MSHAADVVRVRERTMLTWNSTIDGMDRTYAAAGLSLSFAPRFDSERTVTPVLHLRAANGETLEAAGTPGFGEAAQARFGIGELDPSNDTREVVFTSYTGGAHCCTLVVVLSKTNTGWRRIELGPMDGEPAYEFPRDIDGDGIPELVVNDANFAYAFAAYAFSWMPPVVYQFRDGREIDASKDPRYAKLFKDDMVRTRAECVNHANEERNGACAAFIADASRLGHRDFAWPVMLSNYNRDDRWQLPPGCKTMLVDDQCPKGEEIVFTKFPDALAWFLDHSGY
jgi:hypothetical protein